MTSRISNDRPLAFTKPCRDCGQTLLFDRAVITRSGKLIPLNLDGSNHNCTGWQSPHEQATTFGDERRVLSAIQYITELNSKLQTCQLRLIRDDMSVQETGHRVRSALRVDNIAGHVTSELKPGGDGDRKK